MTNNRMIANRIIICFAIALLLIVSIQLVYAGESLKKVGEVVLIANSENSAIPAVPQYSDYMDYIHLWDFDRVDELGSIEKESLSNIEPIDLEKGTYVLKIVDGSWSRWGSDSIDSSYWSTNRNGGQGNVWETSAAVIYNKEDCAGTSSQENLIVNGNFLQGNGMIIQGSSSGDGKIVINSDTVYSINPFPNNIGWNFSLPFSGVIHNNELGITGYGFAYQKVPALKNAQGKTFTLTFKAKKSIGAVGEVYVQELQSWEAKYTIKLDSTDINWKDYSLTFTIPTNNEYMITLATTQTNTGIIGYKNVKLVEENTDSDSCMVIDRFGERNLFSSAEEAEDKGIGKTLEIEHDGGALYIIIDDTPITDNRGSVKVNIYKVVEEENKKNSNINERDVLRGVGFEESVWQCTGWNECNDGMQKRTCTDLNKANIPTNKPAETLSCELGTESTEILKISNDDNKQQGFNLSLIAWIFGIAVIILLILVIIAFIV